jgi:hypothetical protein
MKHGSELSFDDDGRPVLITRAAQPYEEQHRERVRKYLIIMSWRIPALLGAAIAYGIWHNGLVSLAILVASIPLPWIAVLIANDRPPRRARRASPSSPPPSGPRWRLVASPHRNRNPPNGSAMFRDVRLLRLFSGESQVDVG